MATTYINTGTVIDHTPAGALSSDDVIVVGVCLAVVLEDIAASGTGSIQIQGAFTLPAASAAVIAQGEIVIWDVSESEFDDNAATPASGDVTGGAIALAASGNGDTTVDVLLLPGNGTVT